MRQIFAVLILLIVSAVALANPGYLGVVQTKNWIGFPVYALDTATGQWRRPDSIYNHVFYGRLANLPSYTTRLGADIVAGSWIDSMKISSAANPIYMFHDSVGRIDADSGNGQYWGLLQCFYQTKTTDFSYQFTVVDSPYATSLRKAARDSADVDGSTLAGLTGAISATTIASNALDFGAEIDTAGLGANIWAHGTRRLTELDEDNTTIDLNASTIGTVSSVTQTVNAAVVSITPPALDNDTSYASLKTRLWTVQQKTDSALVDGSVLAGLTGAISATTIAANALDFGVEIDTTGLGANIWAHGTRTLTALDEDVTTLDLNATAVGSVTGAVGSVTGKVTLVDSSANDIAMMGNYHALDSTWQKEMHDSLDTQGWAATGSSTGLDSATTSRIIKRTVWGVASGTGSDSTTKAQRIIGSSPAGDTINAHAPHGNNWATTGASAVTPDTIRDIIGDSLATFASAQAVTDSVRKVVGDSIRTQVLPIKNRTDSLAFAGVLTNPSFLRPTTAGRTLDVTTTGEAGVDLSNVNGTLDAAEIGSDAITAAKIAADAIGASEVASGAIVFGTEATGFFNYTSNKVTLVDSSANDIAMMGNYHALDSTWQKEMHDSLDTQTWAISGSVSLTDADIDTIAARTAALIGASQLYPLLDRVALVDAPGAIPKQQFVCDSTSLGGANEYGLLNTAIRIKDVDDGKWSALGIIERVSCTADQCTLQVADTLAFAVEANDTVFVYGGGPAFVQATVYEAATILVDSLLGRDLTGVPQDSLVGGLLKIAALSGGSTFDTTQFLTMWLAHGWYAAMDSLIYRTELGNSNSLPVLGDLFTQAQFEAFNMNVAKIKGDTVLVIDTSRNAGAAALPDSVTQAVMEVQDSVQSQSWAATGSGLGTGANSVTYIVRDTTNDVRVSGAYVTFKDTLETTVAAGPTSTNASGYVTVNLDDGTYAVLVTANSVTFSTDTFTVSGATTDSILGYGLIALVPSDPSLCAVQGYIKDLQNNVVAGALVTFTLQSTETSLTYGDAEYVPTVVTVRTNASGYFSVELIPNATIDSNSTYLYRVEKAGTSGLPRQRSITVPAAASANIDDL